MIIKDIIYVQIESKALSKVNYDKSTNGVIQKHNSYRFGIWEIWAHQKEGCCCVAIFFYLDISFNVSSMPSFQSSSIGLFVESFSFV